MKMYRHHNIIIILLFFFGTTAGSIHAQDSAAVSRTMLSVRYFLPATNVPYLEVTTKKKAGRKFEPVQNILVNIYFNEAAQKNFLGKVITDATGEGRIGLPPSFKNTWDSLDEFKFLAQSDSSAGREPLMAEVTIKKARLTIDATLVDSARTVIGELKEKNGNEWVAVKGVDMNLTIKRMLGNLSVGDEPVYTSDSTGISSAEFKRDSIPGDEKGNIILVARVDDNDTYGTLVTEKTVNWGKAINPPKDFFAQRTLWSTSQETPMWLLLTVWSIVIGIWGTMIYLIFQILKIKKMGRAL